MADSTNPNAPAAAAPSTSSPPPPASRLTTTTTTSSGRPVSEALLNEKWDRTLSSMVVRSTVGLSFGVIFSVLLFKRRQWPVWLGLGFGAGRAWEESDAAFRGHNALYTFPKEHESERRQ